jgi:hypothetical protein
LKRATEKTKKEYLESRCDEIVQFQRTGRYDLMCMKKKEPDWKENQGIQNTGTEDSHGNIMIGQRQVLKNLNSITELYVRANRPKT